MNPSDKSFNNTDPRYLFDFDKTYSTLRYYGVSEPEIERLFSSPTFSIYTFVSGHQQPAPKNSKDYVWHYRRSLVELLLNENGVPQLFIDALPIEAYKKLHEPDLITPLRNDFDKHLVLTVYHRIGDISFLPSIVDVINYEPPFRVISYSAFPGDNLAYSRRYLREIKVRIETDTLEEIPAYSTRLHKILPDFCKHILWVDGLSIFYDAFFFQSFPLTEVGLIVTKYESVEQVESILVRNGYSNITILEQKKNWLKMTFCCEYLYGKNLFDQMKKEGISIQVYGDKNYGEFQKEEPSHWVVASKKPDYDFDDEASVMSGIAVGYGEYWGRD